MNIYFYIVLIINLIILLCLCRKITRTLSYIWLFIISIINYFIFLPKDNLYKIIQALSIIICFFIYYKISSRFTYNFNNEIISLRYIFNSLIPPVIKPGSLIIGKVIPYNNYQLKYSGKYIKINDLTANGGTLISGSTGSGKTYSMLSLIKQNIKNGNSVIFCDYKGENKTANEIIDFALKNNYEVYYLKSNDFNFNYDPLKNINTTGKIEALINMRKWALDGADAHYRTSTQLLLQKLMYNFNKRFKEEDVDNYIYTFYEFVKNYQPAREEFDAYTTVSKLLELLITSDLKNMFEQRMDYTLSFKEIKNKKFLVVVSFVSSNKELATSFSSLMFKDLLDEFTNGPPYNSVYLYIDEFGTLENPFIIKDILEKGRSAKIATILALQDINQIVIKTNEAYLQALFGTINNFIIYNGATRNTAEKFAGVQLLDIENVIMNLRKPLNGKSPTALFISKYPTLNRRTNFEVFRFKPFIYKPNLQSTNKNQTNYNFDYNHRYNSNNDYTKEKNNELVLEINDKNNEFQKEDDINTDIDYNDFI